MTKYFLVYWFICICVFLYHSYNGRFSHLNLMDKIIICILSFIFIPFFTAEELMEHD